MTGLQPSGIVSGQASWDALIPTRYSKEDREDGVEHDDQEDRLNDGGGGAGADFLAVPLDQHALEAAGERDDEAEHRRLDEADPEVGDRNHFLQALNVGDRRDFEREPDEDAAADQRESALPRTTTAASSRPRR